MKTIQYILISFFALSLTLNTGCTDDYEGGNLYPELTADFEFTFDEMTRTATFTNLSENAYHYFWDFGDGTTSTEENPVHTYTEDGTYTITLTITDEVGHSNTYTYDIEVTAYIPLELPIDFESDIINYDFTNFGDAFSEKVANPDMNGNSSGFVGQTLKSTGAQTWAGSLLILDEPMSFGGNNGFTVKVWSPKPNATVRLKIENLTDAGVFYEADAVNTVTNEWETLTFDMSEADFSQSYQKVVIFFDFGNAGDNTTYYFDDIAMTYIPPSNPVVYEEDFESFAGTWTDFGNVTTTVISNPDASGVNTSSMVAHTNKSLGAETWGGSLYEEATALPFAATSQIKMKVWSPIAGAIVKIKVENSADANINYEIDATTTTTNQWEVLTYDFSGIDLNNDYHKIVVFMDFGNTGTGNDFYFDDIQILN